LNDHGDSSGEATDPVDQLVRLGPRHLTWPELCLRAGVPHEVADPLWRALGFPDVPPDEPSYTDDDVRALEIAAQGLNAVPDSERSAAVELMVREARSISAYLMRISEIQVESLTELARYGLRSHAIQEAREQGIERSELGWLLFYGLRRRLDEALRRRAAADPGGQPMLAVGFVDLVDFTRTSSALDPNDIGALLNKFESLVWDVVTEAGGQVVKLIGDEAMFVCPAAIEAARAATEVIGACRRVKLPEARAGLAFGPLLARAGDYFGVAVNLASRLVERADPGGVLIDERFREALREDGELALEPGGRRSLKGIGEVPVWRVETARVA
jgi:adenylate cyclase